MLISSPDDAAAPAGIFPAGSKRKFSAVTGSVIFILILAAGGVALHEFKNGAPNPPSTTKAASPTVTQSEMPKPSESVPEASDGLQAGPVTLQKTEGSGLIYAVGTVRNHSDRQRFGVRVELDLWDEADNKVGTAGDYLAVLEPHMDWSFRALLAQPKTVRAKVAKITEQK